MSTGVRFCGDPPSVIDLFCHSVGHGRVFFVKFLLRASSTGFASNSLRKSNKSFKWEPKASCARNRFFVWFWVEMCGETSGL